MASRNIVQPAEFDWAKPTMTVAEWHEDLLFVSGLVAFEPNGSICSGGMYEQSTRAFENLKIVLTEAGLEMGDVLKITCFLADTTKFAEFAQARGEAFPDRLPVNTTVGGALVMPELLVEVEAIARR